MLCFRCEKEQPRKCFSKGQAKKEQKMCKACVEVLQDEQNAESTKRSVEWAKKKSLEEGGWKWKAQMTPAELSEFRAREAEKELRIGVSAKTDRWSMGRAVSDYKNSVPAKDQDASLLAKAEDKLKQMLQAHAEENAKAKAKADAIETARLEFEKSLAPAPIEFSIRAPANTSGSHALLFKGRPVNDGFFQVDSWVKEGLGDSYSDGSTSFIDVRLGRSGEELFVLGQKKVQCNDYQSGAHEQSTHEKLCLGTIAELTAMA